MFIGTLTDSCTQIAEAATVLDKYLIRALCGSNEQHRTTAELFASNTRTRALCSAEIFRGVKKNLNTEVTILFTKRH